MNIRTIALPAVLILTAVLIPLCALAAPAPDVSDATADCLGCHEMTSPGIVADWRAGAHAATTPQKALEKEGNALMVSSDSVPDELKGVAVGCAECHTTAPDDHADTFDHNGYQVHMVVTPEDCAVCHAKERTQYKDNIMSHAYANLDENPLYQSFALAVNGRPTVKDDKLALSAASQATDAQSCYYCHGTKLEVTGTAARDTFMGEMDFPVIKGWPNNGVGRVNPDGSLGSCAACHTRHAFKISEARKPYTCKQCHDGPDVPAYKVYSTSKHGNIYSARNANWDFNAVPWTLGADFKAPTCAACHMSLLVSPDGQTIAERSHAVMDRLPWRILGLVYAHPQPKSPDTTKIRNADGQPLPTTLAGQPAAEFLIDKKTMDERKERMQATCRGCHATSWVDGHWSRFMDTIEATNESVAASTALMTRLWEQGRADPANIFDEYLEKVWTDTWFFYASHVRFTSAMAGGGDYGVFADGRYFFKQATTELAKEAGVETTSGQ